MITLEKPSPHSVAVGIERYTVTTNNRRMSGTKVLRRLQPHLQAVDDFLGLQVTEFEPEIRPFVNYCLGRTGKRIRATLVFLSGWRSGDGGIPSPEAVSVAAIIEMVHLATLVHDDIMDAAEIRRNQLAAGVKFGIDRSVLLGDALFAQALHLASQFPDGTVCRRVSKAARRVCSGEIMQTLPGGNAEPDIRRYNRIIALKTAELFKAACELGAQTAAGSVADVEAKGRFGHHLGVAYQMYDDLLDYFGNEYQAKKTLGSDYRSGKVTLPFLVLMERLDDSKRQELRHDFGHQDDSGLSKWVAFMERLHVFEEVQAVIATELNRADQALRRCHDIVSAGMLQEALTYLTNKMANLADARKQG